MTSTATTERHPAWERWLLLALVAVVVLTALDLAAEVVVTTRLNPSSSGALFDALGASVFISPPFIFSVTGAIIIFRQPLNPVAWLMCFLALTYSAGILSTDLSTYQVHVLHAHGWPVMVVAVVANLVFVPFLGALAAILMLFPNGRPLNRRWGRVFWVSTSVIGALFLLLIVTPGTLNDSGIRNPLAISFVPSVLNALVPPILIAYILIGLAAVVRRFWVSRGEERQQLKWFTYGAVMLVISTVLAFAVGFSTVLVVPYFVALSLLPVTICIAILKYRLWDIDVLINRTLVYGSLTVCLALIYVGGVLGFQTALRAITGQSSAIAVALATLGVAALFGPLRRRIQQGIDRRFYRRNYDTAQLLSVLSERLRDEIEVSGVQAEVLTVIRESMQPAHASLWLKPWSTDGRTVEHAR